MKLLFIVNTSASSVTERGRVVIQKALSADHEVTTALTSRRGHATRLAQGAASQRLDAVVVLGGDGTLNEAANGLAGSTTALGILPPPAAERRARRAARLAPGAGDVPHRLDVHAARCRRRRAAVTQPPQAAPPRLPHRPVRLPPVGPRPCPLSGRRRLPRRDRPP